MNRLNIFPQRAAFASLLLTLFLGAINCSDMMSEPDKPVSVTSCTGGYSLSEFNGTLELQIVLGEAPTTNVTIPISSSDPSELSISTNQIVFTKSNWNKPQSIYLLGVDDYVIDGNQSVNVTYGSIITTDEFFKGVSISATPITVIDNETAGIVVSPTAGLTTVESGSGAGACTGANNTALFTVVLGSQPSADVTIASIAGDPSEGTPDQTSLTFTPANFNQPQTVTVTCVDDPFLDGDVTYSVTLSNASSGDPYYNNMSVSPVTITNADNDYATAQVSQSVINLTEGGASSTFSVQLTSAPVTPASFDVVSNDTYRAIVDTATITFDQNNYNNPQTINVSAPNNDLRDTPAINTAIISITPADANYQSIDPADVTVNVTDDDIPGVIVSNLSQNTSESGQSGSFTVKLATKPTANVSILVNETNHPLNSANQEGIILGDPVTLTFTPTNWSINQSVTVVGVDEDIDDGHAQYIIRLEDAVSADVDYSAMPVSGVLVNNQNNDTAGFVVSGSKLVSDDMGNLDKNTYSRFSVKLTSEPIADVTLDLVSSQPDDGTSDVAQMVFTSADWSIPQWATSHVSNNGGTPAHTNEGNRYYSIDMVKSTADPKYAALGDPSVSILSCDNDGANLLVGCPWEGNSTSEDHGSVDMWFITQNPTAVDISVPVSSDNLSEGTVTTPAIVTAANWNTLTTNSVTATGVDEADVAQPPAFDGFVFYNLIVGAVSSADLAVDGFDVPDVGMRNRDNEKPFIIDTSLSGSTSEAGGATTFAIMLDVTPNRDVTFTLECGNAECAWVTPATLTFNGGETPAFQTVTIAGADDLAADGDQPNCVAFGPFESTDNVIKDIVPPIECPVTNIDFDKRVWVTSLSYFGNFNAVADMSSPDAACDALSGDTNHPGDGKVYKALMAHSVHRVATTNGTNSTGQFGWVLSPATEYYLKEGSNYINRLFLTDSNALPPFPFDYPFNGASAWTGLNDNWTTGANCGDWSDSVTPGISGQIGTPGVVDTTSVNFNAVSCLAADAIQNRVICVQQ